MFVYLLSAVDIDSSCRSHACRPSLQVKSPIGFCRLAPIRCLLYAGEVSSIGRKSQEVRRVDIDLVAAKKDAFG